jgi:hypothetical protein
MMTELLSKARILICLFSKLPLFYILLKYSVVPEFVQVTYDVIYVNECFHDFMFVNRAPPPSAPVNLVLKHWCKSLKSLYCTIRRLFVDYSRTIRGLFVLFADYIRTIRRLFALFVDYSLHYSSFINCPVPSMFLEPSTVHVLFSAFVL